MSSMSLVSNTVIFGSIKWKHIFGWVCKLIWTKGSYSNRYNVETKHMNSCQLISLDGMLASKGKAIFVLFVNWTTVIFSRDQAALWMVFSVRPSVRPSVRLSHLFDYVPIIVSSWNFQELSPRTRVRSMQKSRSEVKGRGHRGHDPT